MVMLKTKRIFIVLQNSVNSLITPVLSVLFSYIIVKKYNAGLWGSFVYYLIIVSLAVHIFGFGNKDYLLREFSKNITLKNKIWIDSLFSRVFMFPLILIPYYFLAKSTDELIIILILTFVLFFYQAFDVLVVFERKFFASVMVEIISFAFMAGAIFLWGISNTTSLLKIYLYASILKPILLSIVFRKYLIFKSVFSGGINWEYYVMSFPFFILVFTGMLQSRIDIYCLSYFLPGESLGKYQVLTNFLGVFQSTAVFIVAPFVKDIYRLNNDAIKKMNLRVMLAGLIIITPLILILYIAMTYFYNFDFGVGYYICSAFYVIPVFANIVVVYKFYKNGYQNTVIYITCSGILTGLISNIFLIPVLGILGALLSGAISQILMTAVYYIIDFNIGKRIKVKTA